MAGRERMVTVRNTKEKMRTRQPQKKKKKKKKARMRMKIMRKNPVERAPKVWKSAAMRGPRRRESISSRRMK